MSRPSQSPLRRAAWDIAALSDDDRAWIVAQLTREERARLVGVLDEAASVQQVDSPPADMPGLSALPRWLAVRALRALPEDQRAAHLEGLGFVERWRTTLAVRTAANVPLTPLAEQILVNCLSERKGASA